MKINLPQLLLTAGLSVGIISIPSIAEAGYPLNGTSLIGQVSRPTSQDRPQKLTKGFTINGSSLTGAKIKKRQQSKALMMNDSSLTGQSSQK
ncbi:MAG: hypothetical protein QNJ53_00655 [Pleurocapsa sp. MO_192.B19]|nr:hypothetical protein [Pleurocapsa sp. MO_192.B19]